MKPLSINLKAFALLLSFILISVPYNNLDLIFDELIDSYLAQMWARLKFS
jgi:hypothetical protein